MKTLLLRSIAFSGLFLLAHPVTAQTWTQRTNAPADYWISVASSADGAKLYSSSWWGHLMASTNSGVTWNTKIPNNGSFNVYPMTCTPDGTKVVVADYKNPISYSGDSGATWSSLGKIGWWFGVACSADANLIVGISQGTPRTGFIESATNYPGIYVWRGWPANPNMYSNFAVSNNLPLEPWEAVACSTDGTKIVAVGNGAVFTTADSGSTWNQQALGYTDLDWSSVASSADGTKLVAIASGQIYTSSSSGVGWTLTPAPTAKWIQVASSADGTRLVGVIYGGGIYTSWDSGVTWRLNNAPIAYWAAVASSADGRKLVAVVYGGGIYTAELPPLIAAMSATPPRVRTGTNIQVLVTVENNDTNTIANIMVSGGIGVTGAGGVTLIADNSTSMLTTLVPGQSTSFTNIYEATNSGNVIFTATVRGSTVIGPEPDSICTSQVLIVPNGDLLIKRAVESADDYAGLGVFQTVPNSPQVKTNVVANTNDLSQFQVQIQNNDPQTQTYTLLAGEGGNPVWKRTFLLGGADVTAQVEAPGGMTLPPMAPGTALTLTVTVQETNALPGDLNLVEFALGLASDTSFFLDTVEAVTQLVPEIFVNSTGDLPLLDPNGCCCDTGRKLADGKTPECTLRAAIQLANRLQGKDIIKFQIPGNDPGVVLGVPSIQPQTALPDITDPLIIDGWSQSPASTRPPVELSGRIISPRAEHGSLFGRNSGFEPQADKLLLPDLPNGLHLVAAGCEIRGLVINSFPLCGVLVDGPQAVIQGNYLGTDPTGTLSAPSGMLVDFEEQFTPGPGGGIGEVSFWNPKWIWYALLMSYEPPKWDFWVAGGGGAQLCLRTPYNVVGGTDPKSRNVISGGPNQIYPDGSIHIGWGGSLGLVLLGTAAIGNVIEGNIIGLDASASHLPWVPPGGVFEGIGLNKWNFGGSFNRGHGQWYGVWIFNGSGNQIGGSSPGAGNIIAGSFTGVDVTGESATGNVIAGNQIGWSQNLSADASDLQIDVALSRGAHDNLIGGSTPGAGNTIGANAAGIGISGDNNTVQGNWIGVLPDRRTFLTEFVAAAAVGIFVSAANSSQIISNVVSSDVAMAINSSVSSRVIGNEVLRSGEAAIKLFGTAGLVISGNVIHNGTRGIQLFPPTGQVTISQNSIYNNDDLGISYGNGYKPTPNDSGPQNYPQFRRSDGAVLTNGQLAITGTLATTQNGGDYVIEYFASPAAGASGYGQGQSFIGATTVTVGFSGIVYISTTLPFAGSAGEWLTSTATAPDGSTSEFSKAVLIEGSTPTLSGISAEVQNQAPPPLPLSGGKPGQMQPHSGPPLGDGNGDGILDSLQPNVCSFPGIAGKWLTLAAPKGVTLANVQPGGPPDFASMPSGYTFPVGFTSFSMTGLVAGADVSVTNLFHDTFAYTTVFAYGPTPDNAQPHWYEFNFDGTTGAELFADRIILHFRDGARGDDDLAANGQIVTVVAPANPIPAGPPLHLLSATANGVDIVSFQYDTNGIAVLVTNQTTAVSGVLSWPASATNWTLFFKDDLNTSDLIATTNLVVFPDFFWQPVPESPVVVDGQNILTNTAISQSRFYRLSLNYVLPPSSASVSLSVQLTATNTVLFSWPASASGFGLQQNSDLGTTNWVNFTNAVSVVGGNYQAIASPMPGRRFYRLKAQ